MSNATIPSIDQRIAAAIRDTQDLYLSDDLPWVIGYSGGKDSTATLQLVWNAVSQLPPDKLTKPIHVISTDTLVENPVVSIWVQNSLVTMTAEAARQRIPIQPHRLVPELKDRFWVNLIGRGYPAPRPLFRWCTSRLKISASTKFITEVADQQGEAILVLGSRRAESIARERVLKRYEHSTRELLSRNSDASMDRVWIYTPISTWSSDDVWEYLVTQENPWGYDNLALFHMYRGASPDAECPLVVDKSTPSCGDSRFGCFVCTMVSEDKSMQAMIQNDDEKKWMAPLLDFRNRYLKTDGDRVVREFTRMDGALTLQYLDVGQGGQPPEPFAEVFVEEKGKDGNKKKVPKYAVLVHGPYTQARREELLEQLLIAQRAVNELAPKEVGEYQLITLEEIEEIRRIWVHEKHEFEDSVPGIFERALNRQYPVAELDESTPFRHDDMRLLRRLCEESVAHDATKQLNTAYLHFRTLRSLLDIEHSYRSALRRVGLIEKLDKVLESGSFESEEEALVFALQGRDVLESIDNGTDPYIQPAALAEVELNGDVSP